LTSLLCSSNSLAIVTGSEELRSYLAVRKINRCLQCLKTCQIRPDMRTLLPSALFAHRHARERSLKHVSWGRPNALTSFLPKLESEVSKKPNENGKRTANVGITRPRDVDYFTRVRCYQLILAKFQRAQQNSRCCCLRCEWRTTRSNLARFDPQKTRLLASNGWTRPRRAGQRREW